MQKREHSNKGKIRLTELSSCRRKHRFEMPQREVSEKKYTHAYNQSGVDAMERWSVVFANIPSVAFCCLPHVLRLSWKIFLVFNLFTIRCALMLYCCYLCKLLTMSIRCHVHGLKTFDANKSIASGDFFLFQHLFPLLEQRTKQKKRKGKKKNYKYRTA